MESLRPLTPGRVTSLVVCMACAVFALGYPLNHDVGWYLHVAAAMRDGASLYTTLIEINPPLYAYLARLPVLASDVVSGSAVHWMLLLILGLTLAGVLLAGRFAKSHRGVHWREPLLTIALAVPLLALVGVDFGQREHLMAALTAPYLTAMAIRLAGDVDRRTAWHVAAGLLAGIGFSLKPHFVVLWLALEVAVFATGRRRPREWFRRPEILSVGGFLVAYGTAVIFIHPEYVRLLVDAGPVYAEYLAVDRFRLLINRYSLLLGVVLAAALLFRPSDASRPFVRVFLLAAAVGFLMAVGQGKGWLYHFFPAFAWTVASAILWLGDQLIGAYRRPAGVGAGRVLAIVLLLVTGFVSAGSLVVHHRSLAESRRAYVAEQAAYYEARGFESIVILSPLLPAAFPLVNYAEVEWRAPFPSLWWVDALHGTGAGIPTDRELRVPDDGVERRFLDLMGARLAEHPPDAILVDTAGQGGAAAFRWAAYLALNPEFSALWGSYERDGAVGPFEVYSRKAGGAAVRR